MPWFVPVLLLAWIAFAAYLTHQMRLRLRAMPHRYLGMDLIWKIFTRRLPPLEQQLYTRHLLRLFSTLILLVVLLFVSLTMHYKQ